MFSATFRLFCMCASLRLIPPPPPPSPSYFHKLASPAPIHTVLLFHRPFSLHFLPFFFFAALSATLSPLSSLLSGAPSSARPPAAAAAARSSRLLVLCLAAERRSSVSIQPLFFRGRQFSQYFFFFALCFLFAGSWMIAARRLCAQDDTRKQLA